jgi:hypothetical protein
MRHREVYACRLFEAAPVLVETESIERQAFGANESQPLTELRTLRQAVKQGLTAVCNKLLKQVFAVMKSGTLYQPNYCPAKT